MVSKNRVELLSDNNVLLLEEAFKNQNLMKLIYYGQRNPLDQADVTFSQMFDIDNKGNKLSPIPYSNTVPMEQGCELRIWFPIGLLKNRAYANTDIVFQFIYHNEVALINIDGKSKMRHYEVLSEIINTFDSRTIGTLGALSFEGQQFRYFQTGSNDYGMYQITAKMMTL